MTVVYLNRWTKIDLEGSLLNVECDQTVAVDGGRAWTGITQRVGTNVVDAATVGLFPGKKVANYDDIPSLNAFDVWGDYFERVLAVAEAMVDTLDPGKPIRVVTEAMNVPSRHNYIPMKDWVPVSNLIHAICGRFSRVYVVAPQNLGSRHWKSNGGTGEGRDYYKECLLRKGRPKRWRANDHPQRTMQHERSGSDLAAVAHLQIHASTEYELRELMRGGKEVTRAA